MSQENNLNLNIADILNEIKGMSDEQIKQIQSDWNGIPGNRILIYKDIILALENNSGDEQISGKFFSLAIDVYDNAVIEQLDVKIIMSFVEKILEKANNKNPEDQHWSNITMHLFNSLDIATLKLYQLQTKIGSQDLKQIISLAKKVLNCGNITHTNIGSAVNNVFTAIYHFISMLSENIETGDISDIISLAQSVEDDNDMKWANIVISSIVETLDNLLNVSSNLSKSSADNIVKILGKLTDKLEPDKPSLTYAIEAILKLFSYILTDLQNPANLSPEESMKLIGQLLKKINVLNSSGNKIKNLRSIASYVSKIVQYYSKNQENVEIITDCGFNIDKENGQIQSLDADKLKAFAGECMADQLDHFTYRIGKSETYQKVMLVLSAENINSGLLNYALGLLVDEAKKYCDDGNGELEDLETAVNLMNKILNLEPNVTLEDSTIFYMFFTFDIAASRISLKGRTLTNLEKKQLETVMSFMETFWGSGSQKKSGCHWIIIDLLRLLISGVIGEEYHERIAGCLKSITENKNIIFDIALIGPMFNVWIEMVNVNKNITETHGNDIVNFIKRVVNTEFPSDNLLEENHISQALYVMWNVLRAKPQLLQAKEGLELVKSLLKQPMSVDKDPQKAWNEKIKLADLVSNVIVLYCDPNQKENIEIIKGYGFGMGDNKIVVSDLEKLKEFAGEDLAGVIMQRLRSYEKSQGKEEKQQDQKQDDPQSKTQHEENNLNGNNNNNEAKEQEQEQKQEQEQEQEQGNNATDKTNEKNNRKRLMRLVFLESYNNANELLTSDEDKQNVASNLKNVEVSFWDKLKFVFSWLWFMICNRKMVSFDIYTKAAKYYSDSKKQTQDNNQMDGFLEDVTNLDDKNQDNSEEGISFKDKINGAIDKSKQSNPEFNNDKEKGNGKMLANKD